MSDVWLFFTHFFYRSPIYSEGVAILEVIEFAILCPDKGKTAVIAHSVCQHYALAAYIGRARVIEPYLGSLLEAVCHLQELLLLEDKHVVAEYRELKQPAMRHAAYLLAQFKTFLVGDGFGVCNTYRCRRGVGIEHLVLGKTFRYIFKHINLSHSYITSPPIMKPPNTATAMKAKKPAMVIATSP